MSLLPWPVFLIVQGLGLWLAVDVVLRGRTAQGATAWALALVLLPILAIPLYLVFGERRFEGYMRARRRGREAIDRLIRELDASIRPHCKPLGELHANLQALERLAKLPFTNGNSARLLIDGEATFSAIFAAIDQARDYVLVQYYIIRDDELGRRLQAALISARQRGVRVYLLYDEIGSYSLPRSYLETLRQAGCELAGFRTKKRRQKPFRLNFRNHRKIVVVDGEVAFVGGLNVGDEYMGRNPAMSPWRDTHVELRGPAVAAAQLTFCEDWNWVHKAVPRVDWAVRAAPDADLSALVVPSGPADELETCGLLMAHIANTARRRLWIATPYFVPDEPMLAALQLAALRGVDVRVIIPERSDAAMIWYSSFTFYNDVLPTGIKLYRFRQGFMHQKVVLCDDLACVGTANLDNRSFRINFEITAVIADAPFAQEVHAMLERDLARCRLVEKGEFERLPLRIRFLARLSRLLSPIQ